MCMQSSCARPPGRHRHLQKFEVWVVGGGHDDEDEPEEEDIKLTPKRHKRSHKKPQVVAETIDLTDDAEVSSADGASPPLVPDEAQSSSVVKVKAVQSSTLRVEEFLT